MTRRDVERRLRRLPLPAPRPELRDGVLREAAAAVPTPRGRRGVAERLWFSRRWRWGWVTAVALFLLAEEAVQRGIDRRIDTPIPVAPSPLAAVARELGLEPDWRTTVTPVRERSSIEPVWIEAR